MKAVFCNPLNGSWPDWAKFRKYGLTRIYVDARESNQRKDLVPGIKSQGFEAGLYRDPGWTNESATNLGLLAHNDLLFAGAKYRADQCAYLFDIEIHDSQYVLDTIASFKKNRPTREFAWTLEGHQGGWFSQELVNHINADEFMTVIPQCYVENLGDSMYPYSERYVLDDLTAMGVSVSKLAAFYDGIRGAPAGMNGIVFTDGRLPA